MDDLTIELENGRSAFAPGEELRGTVAWDLRSPATGVEVRLFWYTRGKGTTDVNVATAQRFDTPGLRGCHGFRFVLPDSPYSFSGKLVSLVWAVEAIADPGERSTRTDLVIAPDAREVLLSEKT